MLDNNNKDLRKSNANPVSWARHSSCRGLRKRHPILHNYINGQNSSVHSIYILRKSD